MTRNLLLAKCDNNDNGCRTLVGMVILAGSNIPRDVVYNTLEQHPYILSCSWIFLSRDKLNLQGFLQHPLV